MPTPLSSTKSPDLMIYNLVPEYKSFKTFGCVCFPHLRQYLAQKFNFHSQQCIFLGYPHNHKGYKCLAANGRIYISRDVVFNEEIFLYPHLFPSITSSSSPTSQNTTSSIFPTDLISQTPLPTPPITFICIPLLSIEFVPFSLFHSSHIHLITSNQVSQPSQTQNSHDDQQNSPLS